MDRTRRSRLSSRTIDHGCLPSQILSTEHLYPPVQLLHRRDPMLAVHDEEVVGKERLAIAQLLLGSLKVELDVERGEELRDGVRVRVALLLDHLHEVAKL